MQKRFCGASLPCGGPHNADALPSSGISRRTAKHQPITDADAGGTPEGTRTPHLLLRRQLLYPDELLARMERVMGIEPTPTAWKAVVLAVILHPRCRVLHQP